MEFLLELFLTVVFSLAMAFLFAKLLPKASAAEDVEQEQEEEKEKESLLRRRRRRRRSEEKMIGGFDGEVGKEEKSFVGDELKNRGLESEKRVVEVVGETMVVDKYEEEVGVEGSEMGHGGDVGLLKEGFELEQLVEVSAIGSEDEVVEEIKIVQVEESPCEEEKEVEAAVTSTEDDEVEEKLVLGSSEEVGVGLELAQEEQIIAQDQHVGVIDECIEEEEEEDQEKNEIEVEKTEPKCEEMESLFSDEDDWEGIERSEMEKIFGAASTFVGSSENNECLSKLGSDVQMQLYGLNKVANEGPCHEPQPLAIMVSSRAKWHAWQRLGNMSPEVAMEAYIALLSDNVPGWMGKIPDGDNKQNTGTDSPEAEAKAEAKAEAEVSITTKDYNLNSSPNQKPVPENERKQGVQSCDEITDAMGGPEHQ